MTGAAPVPVELIKRMRSELSFETILTAYGLTESTGVVSMCRRDRRSPRRSRTRPGCAIPDTEVRIVDENNNELPPGEPGEIVVRGYNVMRGYYQDPQATADTIDGGGWLHTGDIGVMDRARLHPDHGSQEGHVHRRRVQRLPGGDRERSVGTSFGRAGGGRRHPGRAAWARSAARSSLPRTGETIDPDELMAWARDRMANYKVPRRVEVVDALPLNASGKVLKYRTTGESADDMSDDPTKAFLTDDPIELGSILFTHGRAESRP